MIFPKYLFILTVHFLSFLKKYFIFFKSTNPLFGNVWKIYVDSLNVIYITYKRKLSHSRIKCRTMLRVRQLLNFIEKYSSGPITWPIFQTIYLGTVSENMMWRHKTDQRRISRGLRAWGWSKSGTERLFHRYTWLNTWSSFPTKPMTHPLKQQCILPFTLLRNVTKGQSNVNYPSCTVIYLSVRMMGACKE